VALVVVVVVLAVVVALAATSRWGAQCLDGEVWYFLPPRTISFRYSLATK
jgi:hypothetical protein